MKRFVIFSAAVIVLVGCIKNKPETFQKTETIMGTVVTVTVAADSAEKGNAAIDEALDEIKRLDRMMSLYKDESEITKVNMAAGRQPVKVLPEVIEAVEEGNKVSEMTHGAFDVTIGPLVVLWQMRLKEGKVPSDSEIRAVITRVGYKNIVIDKKKSTIFLSRPGMILDLGGVAKGYAADRAAAVLAAKGIKNAIVSVAGDIRVMGRRPDGRAWRIGIQHPREKEKTIAVLELSDISISTSGDYERFQVINNKRYHHILDARTGLPSTGVESVTVIGDRGAVTDPLTTALFILGPKEGIKIAKQLGYEALFVDERGNVIGTGGVRSEPNQTGK